jgi:uncharacterized membrane protein
MPNAGRITLAIIAVALLCACVRGTPAPTPESAPAAGQDPSAAAPVEQAPEPSAPSQSAPSAPPPDAAQGKRAAGQENEPVLAWRAFGNEPFWSARVDGDVLVFSTPEDQDGQSMQGRRVPSLVGFVFVGEHGGKEFHLGIRDGECSDGMSDNRYAYVSTFIYAGTTYTGCAEAAK